MVNESMLQHAEIIRVVQPTMHTYLITELSNLFIAQTVNGNNAANDFFTKNVSKDTINSSPCSRCWPSTSWTFKSTRSANCHCSKLSLWQKAPKALTIGLRNSTYLRGVSWRPDLHISSATPLPSTAPSAVTKPFKQMTPESTQRHLGRHKLKKSMGYMVPFEAPWRRASKQLSHISYLAVWSELEV